MHVVNSFPLIMIVSSYIMAFLGILIYKNKFSKFITNASAAILLVMSLFVLRETLTNGAFSYNAGHFGPPWGIELYIGKIESIIAVLFTSIYLITVWFSLSNIDIEIDQFRVKLYYFLTNIMVGSLLGVVFTNDIFNAYVFIEIGTLASCGLIVVKNKKESFLATMKYLVFSNLGSGLFVMGIAFIYSITGNLNMSFIHEELVKSHSQYPNVILISTALFTIGMGIKSAMFPLHTWMPDGYSSAPATSGLLSSSLVIKAFFFLYVKIIYRVLGPEVPEVRYIFDVILILGCAGMIIGSALAIMQKQIKRRIAYSTVAQMGYLFFGIGLGTTAGLVLALYHIIAHAVAKAILFISSGSMSIGADSKYIKDLKGIGKFMPIELLSFTLAALSMVGIPILPGFVSKWNLSMLTIDSGNYVLLGVVIVSGLLNTLYYFPIIIRGFFEDAESPEKLSSIKKFDFNRTVPLILLSIGLIFAGAYSNEIIEIFSSAL